MCSDKFVFFGLIGKTRWPPWPLIGWDIFDFSSETAEFNKNWQEARSQVTSSTKILFFGPIGKTRWPPWHLIGWDIFNFSAERNSTKLDRKQDLNILYQGCVFRVDRKTRWPSLLLIGGDIFDFSSETAVQKSTKLDRNQFLNILYLVCVFLADE